MSRRTSSYDLQLVFDRPDRRCAGTGRRCPPMPCYPGVGYDQEVGRGTARALVVSDGRWPQILIPGPSSSAVTRSSPISLAPNNTCTRRLFVLYSRCDRHGVMQVGSLGWWSERGDGETSARGSSLLGASHGQ